MTVSPQADLNDIITSAVNARVEAAVLEALSGDETIGKMVVAALQQHVEVPADAYRKVRVPFLNHLMQEAIRGAAKKAVTAVLATETEALENAVRLELVTKIPDIAAQMVANVSKRAAESYGVSVNLRWPGE